MNNENEINDNPKGFLRFKLLIDNYSLVLYFFLCYLLMSVPVFLIDVNLFPFFDSIFWLIAIWSPTISAIGIRAFINGWKGVKELLSGWLKWKVNWFWYFAAAILTFGPLLVAIIYNLLGGESLGMDPSLTLPILTINFFFSIHNGPLCEETGWRGFALPKLEARFGAMISSLLLGILWACWHLPLYLIEERMNFLIFLPICIAITILMTWAYNNTEGSLFITFLFHFFFNFGAGWISGILGLIEPMIYYISGGIMITVFVGLIILIERPAKFSRKLDSEMPFIVRKN